MLTEEKNNISKVGLPAIEPEIFFKKAKTKQSYEAQ